MLKFKIPINLRLISFVQIQFGHNVATFGATLASLFWKHKIIRENQQQLI